MIDTFFSALYSDVKYTVGPPYKVLAVRPFPSTYIFCNTNIESPLHYTCNNCISCPHIFIHTVMQLIQLIVQFYSSYVQIFSYVSCLCLRMRWAEIRNCFSEWKRSSLNVHFIPLQQNQTYNDALLYFYFFSQITV